MNKFFAEFETENFSANELMFLAAMVTISVVELAIVWLMNNHIINLL
jgi:hypothetical protein